MEIHAIGIDLGKTLFHMVGVDSLGRPAIPCKLWIVNSLRIVAISKSVSNCFICFKFEVLLRVEKGDPALDALVRADFLLQPGPNMAL
jgi:hypothetical protein